jgi:hypothetical protein
MTDWLYTFWSKLHPLFKLLLVLLLLYLGTVFVFYLALKIAGFHNKYD